MNHTPSPLPQDVRVGVIGVGQMGADHVARITERIKSARVSVLTDYFRDKAEELSASVPGSRVVDTAEELIAADDVDAVLIASPGMFHKDQVLACIAADKPVLCEKPLAMNPRTRMPWWRPSGRPGSRPYPSASCAASTPSTRS